MDGCLNPTSNTTPKLNWAEEGCGFGRDCLRQTLSHQSTEGVPYSDGTQASTLLSQGDEVGTKKDRPNRLRNLYFLSEGIHKSSKAKKKDPAEFTTSRCRALSYVLRAQPADPSCRTTREGL